MHRLTAEVGLAVLVVGAMTSPAPAKADSGPVVCPPDAPATCFVKVTAPGLPRVKPVPSRRASNGVECVDTTGSSGATPVPATVVPCATKSGWWSNALQCYVALMDPQPGPTEAFWQGHYPSGAVYMCTTAFTPSTRLVWLAAPPAGSPVPPAQLARQALAMLTIPRPVVLRSPPVDNSDNGRPYTWVNVWTWWWTSPVSWRTLTATATAGPQWATVTVAPTMLRVTPGDGSADVTCPGPGRAWTDADADGAPSRGGCGYMYRHVTAAEPVTATVAVDWSVTWRGAGGAVGTLPPMRTESSTSFVVEQIQVVNR